MKDREQQKIEEIEPSHTLGGAGEGRAQGRGQWRGCVYYKRQNESYEEYMSSLYVWVSV